MPNASTQTVSFECVSGIHHIQSSITNSTRSIGTQTESDNDLTITVIDDSRHPSGSLVLRREVEVVVISDTDDDYRDDSTVSIAESFELDQVVYDSDMDSGYGSETRQRANQLLTLDSLYDYLLYGE